jgi:hypothetical protein
VLNEGYALDSIREIPPSQIPPSFFQEFDLAEKDLMDILTSHEIDVRIIGEEYQIKPFTGKELDIDIYYNKRRHGFSTTELRKRIAENPIKK